VEIASLVGTRLAFRGGVEVVSFDVKAKLEEKERKSQAIVVSFGLLFTTKPSVAKFELEGTATLNGKDEDIKKMLEVDPETKMPQILLRIYQSAFTATYLLSTILNVPPPPPDLLSSTKQEMPVQGINVEIEPPEDAVKIQADTSQTDQKDEVTTTK
jgi:hypothetical protein